MRGSCGTPDRKSLLAGFQPNTDGDVWPKRQFTYAFDPERNCKDLPVSQARAAVRRAFNSWEEGGAELAFTEVGIDDEPDITIQWVKGVHSDPGGEHDTMIDNRDENGNPIPPSPVAHAPYPPALTQVDFVPRYICFDDEEQTWVVAPDTDGDDTADDPMPADQSDVEEVAVHEIGHFLGLDHSDKAGSVMQAGIKTQRSLGDDDIAGIQFLYPPQGRARFNAIWTKDDIPRKALQQIDAADLKDRLDAEDEKGWQPIRITSYQEPVQPRRYNVVLDETDRDLRWSSGKTREEFEERNDELSNDGYELIFVDTGAGGQAWSGVWKPDENSHARMEFFDDDPDGAPQRLEEAVGDVIGARPMDVDVYIGDDGRFYANLIFWKNETPSRVHFGRTWDEFLELLDDLESDWGVTAAGAYVLPDGSERWNLIVQEGNFSWRVRAGYGGYDIKNEITHLEADDFEAWALNAYVLPESASTASLTAEVVSQEVPPPTLVPASLGVAVDATRAYFTSYLQDKVTPAEPNQPGRLVVVDRTTLEVVHPGVAVGHQPRHVAVNPTTGRIYVVNWGKFSYGVTAIDGATFEVLATIDLKQGPLQVAVNPTINRVYVTNWFQGRVHVIDGATHQQLPPIDLGKGPVGIDVDPTRNQIYVAVTNRSVPPFRTGLHRITDEAGGAGYDIEPFVDIAPLHAQPQDVAVDAAHDRVYVANLGGGSVAPSVSVFHRSDLDLLATVKLTAPGRAIAVNRTAREVYVATDRGIEFVDGATNTWLRRIDGHAAWNIAAAQGNARQLFLAERNGSLTRLA